MFTSTNTNASSFKILASIKVFGHVFVVVLDNKVINLIFNGQEGMDANLASVLIV